MFNTRSDVTSSLYGRHAKNLFTQKEVTAGVDFKPRYAKFVEPESEVKIRGGNYTPHNKLNCLTGKEWLKFTSSWFIFRPPPRKSNVILHPATYPYTLVQKYVEFFTKKGAWVLDPFAGSGSTQYGCQLSKRNAVGIELTEKWAKIAADRSVNYTVHGNSLELDEMKLPEFDFSISSPPYYNLLSKPRGGFNTRHKLRRENGLDIVYSNDENDVGNTPEYADFRSRLVTVFNRVRHKLKVGSYCAVILQNLLGENSVYYPIAFDITSDMIASDWKFCGEQIWCQSDKFMNIWGYPSTFVNNIRHHYVLTFRKMDA